MKNIIITITAVLSLIGCSPQEDTTIADLLTREVSWMNESKEYGKAFEYNQEGELMSLMIFRNNDECYYKGVVCNLVATELTLNSFILYMRNDCNPANEGDIDYTITYTFEGDYLKEYDGKDNKSYYYQPDSTTIICNLI